ncbi:MAG: S9 family peptidase [Wenzhouxiangellaceae bacterium]
MSWPPLALCCLLASLAPSLPAGAAEVESRQEDQLVLSGIPAADEAQALRLSHYLATRDARFAGWLSDDDEAGIVVLTRFGQTRQLHRVRRPGGSREQITFGDDPVLNAWPLTGVSTPQLLFLRDFQGNENFQIYHLDLSNGDLQRLSDGLSRHGALVQANQPYQFAHYITARNQRDWDLVSLSAQQSADQPRRQWRQRLIRQGEGTWLPLDWSPDDQWLLALRVSSAAISLPYLLRADGEERIALYPEGEREAYMDGRFDRKGRAIFLLSNRGREFVGLFRLDLGSGELRLVLDLPHDIEQLAISPDRSMLALVINEQGYSRLRLLASNTLKPLRLPPIPDGVIDSLRFSADSSQLGFSLGNASHPGDAYAIDLRRQHLTRWTRSEMGGLPEEQMVEPRLIDYPGYAAEGEPPLQIPAWYYPARDRSQPRPVVVYIHGGPEIQARPRFDPLIQYWVRELGLAVLVPNVRGSQGYGRSYISLDDGRRREDAVRDIGALLDWIAQQPELDHQRVGLYGASYGGYMVLSSMAHFADRVRAGVDLNGITDFVTFLRNTSEYRRDHRRGEYGDERRATMREFLRSISPQAMSDRIVSPLFIAQGANDPRVPASQSASLVETLRQDGREVWYFLAADEGHGFRKQRNRIRLHTAIAQFWQRHLLQAPPAPDS